MYVTLSTHQVILRAEGVWKSYEHNTIKVLNGVDFQASTGETVALCGSVRLRQKHLAPFAGRFG